MRLQSVHVTDISFSKMKTMERYTKYTENQRKKLKVSKDGGEYMSEGGGGVIEER